MPRFKQPIPLQKLALECVVRCTADHCYPLGVKGSRTELRESIEVIKQYVSDRISGSLFVEFCRRFLDKYESIARNRPNCSIFFIGLACEADVRRYLNPCNVHEIRGLKVLDWSDLPNDTPVPRGLENYHLQDLTTFIFPHRCTDLDLEIIGSRCLKLEVLRIEHSEYVTDKGLRALSPCSELRFINIFYCSVSDIGVNELLDVHKKIEEFNAGRYRTIRETSFDLLSRPITSVCPSVKRFSFETAPVTNAHLHSVVALFPNLIHLKFYSTMIGDLCTLKGLKNLAKVDFLDPCDNCSTENLNELLKTIGANIRGLMLHMSFGVTQNDLNFLSKACANIEVMHIYYVKSDDAEKLIVPPFRNLKHFECFVHNSDVKLEFCEMLKLEILRIEGFHAIFETIKSMMLDRIKFPNLTKVQTSCGENFQIFNHINQTAQNNNLDFELRPSHDRW